MCFYKKLDLFFQKILSPCENIHPVLYNTAQEVSTDLTTIGYPFSIGFENATGMFCNEMPSIQNFGYTLPYGDTQTDFFISNTLLSYKNTLYNVVLHEVLHCMGLHHSPEKGIMSYAVQTNWWGSVVNDGRKLWLSIDDLKGLFYLKNIFSLEE